MFEVSEEALKRIEQFLEGREGPRSIRIVLTEGGWRGPYLVMAVDAQKETDEVFTKGGVTFLVEKALFERVKPISIDYVESIFGAGYTLKSELLNEFKGADIGCHEICDG